MADTHLILLDVKQGRRMMDEADIDGLITNSAGGCFLRRGG